MRNTKTIPTCKETIRREHENDSDRRGDEIVAAYNYPDLVESCVVDWGRGPVVTFHRKIRREEEEE